MIHSIIKQNRILLSWKEIAGVLSFMQLNVNITSSVLK